MGYAFSNNGISYRLWDKPNDLAEGEFYFETLPNHEEIVAVFPNHDTASAILDLKKAAIAALNAGITISSASGAIETATYSTDSASLANINAVCTYILINNKFPGGVASFPMGDKSGKSRIFPNVTVFHAWATAIADYVATLNIILMQGAGTLPESSVAID